MASRAITANSARPSGVDALDRSTTAKSAYSTKVPLEVDIAAAIARLTVLGCLGGGFVVRQRWLYYLGHVCSDSVRERRKVLVLTDSGVYGTSLSDTKPCTCHVIAGLLTSFSLG